MTTLALADRIALAEKIRTGKEEVARGVTEEFLRRHPDWLVRYGERARRLGNEDAGYHLEFLAGAIESGLPEAFAGYGGWAAGMLAARGIAPAFVMESLQQIQEALSSSLGPGECELVRQYVAAGCARATAPAAPEPEAPVGGALALSCRLFLQAILRGQRKAALTVALDALGQGHSMLAIYTEVLQDSQYQVGRLWQTNRITVAEEHMATAITQCVMAELYARIEPPTTCRGRAVITGVEGELHQVGASMVADVLELDGWDVRFLGTNLPHGGILRAIEDHQADVLGVSATMLFNVPRVRQLVADVRQRRWGRRLWVCVGGGAFRVAPALAAEIGADGTALDLQGARALLAGLRVDP